MSAVGESAGRDGGSPPLQNGFLKDAATSLHSFDAPLQLQPRPARGSPGVIGPQSILARKGDDSLRMPSPLPVLVPTCAGSIATEGSGNWLPLNGKLHEALAAKASEMVSVPALRTPGSAFSFQQAAVDLAAGVIGADDPGAATTTAAAMAAGAGTVAATAAVAAIPAAPPAAPAPGVATSTAAVAPAAAPVPALVASSAPAAAAAATPAAAAPVATTNDTVADVCELRQRLEQATLQVERFKTAEKQLLAQGDGPQASCSRVRRPQQAKGKSPATGTRGRHSVADDDAEYTGGSTSSSDDAEFGFDGRDSPIILAPTRRQPGRKRKLSAAGSGGGGRAGTPQPPAGPPYGNGDHSAAANRRRQNSRFSGSGAGGGGGGSGGDGSRRERRYGGAAAASASGAPITIAGYVSDDDAVQEAPLADGEEVVLPANPVTMLLAASVVRSLGSGAKTDMELGQAARRDLERCRSFLPALGQEPVSPDALDVRLAGDVLQALGLVRQEVADAAGTPAVAGGAERELHPPSEEHGSDSAPCACRGIISYATSVLGPQVGAVLSRSGKGRARPRVAATVFSGDGIGTSWGSLSNKHGGDGGSGGGSSGVDTADFAGVSTEAIAAALAAAVDAPALGALIEGNLGGMVEWDWGGVIWDDGGLPAAIAAVASDGGPGAAAARAGVAAAVAAAVRQARELLREGRWNPFVAAEFPAGSSEGSAAHMDPYSTNQSNRRSSRSGLPSAADTRALEDLALGAGSDFGEPGGFSATATPATAEETAAPAGVPAAADMEMDLQESAVAAAAAEAADGAATVEGGSSVGGDDAADGGSNGGELGSGAVAEEMAAGSGNRRGGGVAMDVCGSGGGGGSPSPLRPQATIEPLPLAAPTPLELSGDVSGGCSSRGGGGRGDALKDLDFDEQGDGGGNMTPGPLTLGDSEGGWEDRLGEGDEAGAPLTPGSTRNLSAAAAAEAAAGMVESGDVGAPASPWATGSVSRAAAAAAEAAGLSDLSREAVLAGSLRELSVGGVPGDSNGGGGSGSGGGGSVNLVSPRRQLSGASWPGAADAAIAAASQRAPFLNSPLVARSPASLKASLAAFLRAAADSTVGARELAPLGGGGASSSGVKTVLPAHVRCLADEGLFDVIEVATGTHWLEQVYAYLAEVGQELPLAPEAFRLAMDGEVYPGSALEKKFGNAVQEVMLLWLHARSFDWIEWQNFQDPVRTAAAAAAAADTAATQPPPARQRSSSGSNSSAVGVANRRAARYRIDPAQDVILPRWRRKARRLAAMQLEAARLALREETMLRELCKRCGVALPPGYTRADALRRLRLGVSTASADRSGRENGSGGGNATAAAAGNRCGAGFTPGLSAMALLKKAGLQEPPPAALAASAAAAAAASASSAGAGAGDSDTECGPRIKRKLSQGGAASSGLSLAGAGGGAARILPHAVPPMDLRPRMARYPGGGSGRKRSRGGSMASFPLGSSSENGRGGERVSTPRPRYDDDDDYSASASAATAAALASREWGRSGIDDVMLVTRATPWEDVSRQFTPVQDLSSTGVGSSSGGGLTPLPRQGSNDQDWEELALQNRAEIVRRVSSAGTAGVGGEIFAPSFRLLMSGGTAAEGDASAGGGAAEGGESSGEEDTSDEAYLSRHAEHLEHMREQLDAARKAREALASPRQPAAGRSSKKATPRSSWDSKGATTPGSSPPPTPGGTVAAGGLTNSWSFAAAAIGGRSSDADGGAGKAASAGGYSSYGFGLGLCGETPGDTPAGGGGGSPTGTVWLGGAVADPRAVAAVAGSRLVAAVAEKEQPDNGRPAAAADGGGGKTGSGKRSTGKRKGGAGQRAATPPAAAPPPAPPPPALATAMAAAAQDSTAAPAAEGGLPMNGAAVGAGLRQKSVSA